MQKTRRLPWYGMAIIALFVVPAPVMAQEQTDPNVLWNYSFDKLKLTDNSHQGWATAGGPNQIAVEWVPGAARLRKVSEVSYVPLQRYVPVDCRPEGGYRYLQMKMGLLEQGVRPPQARNASTGGIAMGTVYTGITTFDLSPQPFFGKQDSFCLSLAVFSHDMKGREPGWQDVEWIRNVKIPYDGLTMDLLEEGTPNQTAEVGKKIRLRYYARERVSDPIRVNFFVASNMAPYQFNGDASVLLNDEGKDGDEKAGDKVYTRILAIDANAFQFTTGKEKKDCNAVLASAQVNTESVHTYAPFFFDVRTKNQTIELLKGVTSPEAIKNRLLWMKETVGENLAAGKPAKFSRTPTYGLTTGESDTADLTDGKLSACGDDKIWFARAAVGWYGSDGATEGVNILLDLGSVQPIGKVVARFLAGGEQRSLWSPSEIKVVVSENGKDFYEVASLTKLQPAERSQADWKTTYWLPETGRAYTYPFAFPLKTKGRYVGLRVTAPTDSLFSDEMAVIKGDFPLDGIGYAEESKIDFITEGIIFQPRKNYLAISTNITTPNFFTASDCRRKEDREKPVTLVLETPPQVSFLSTDTAKNIQKEEMADEKGRKIRWKIPAPSKFARYLARNPYYLKIEGTLPNPATVCFYALCEGYEPNRIELPLRAVAIPKVPPFKDMHISLSWMGENNTIGWPGFLDAYAHLGFNTVPLFPRYWGGKPQHVEFVAEARKRGFKFLCNESPFHVMVGHHPKEQEIYSQLDSGPSKNACPAYRGRFYKEEIQRVGDCYELTGADYFIYDMEMWYSGGCEAEKCRRCREWQAQNGGKPMDECLVLMGCQIMADMYDEIRAHSRKLNRPMPVVLMYDLHASDPLYQMATDFRRLCPGVIEGSQPSLYLLPTPWLVHDEMRREYEALRVKMECKGPLVPMLSPGCYGEAESEKVEMMVLEALLNGATGIGYYCFSDFDTPMDYYYHAKALAEVAPYQELLAGARCCEVDAGNPTLQTSGMWNEKDELLVLVANYQGSKSAKAVLALPFKTVTEVLDISGGKPLPNTASVELEIPAHGFRLLHVRGKR